MTKKQKQAMLDIIEEMLISMAQLKEQEELAGIVIINDIENIKQLFSKIRERYQQLQENSELKELKVLLTEILNRLKKHESI